MSKEIVLAVDLGGTNLRMAVVDRLEEVMYRTRRATPKDEGVDEIVQSIVQTANECQEKFAGFKIKGICVAVPGTVDSKNGIIIMTPNLPVLNDFNLSAALENKLGIKAILENDANAAAVGEYWRGASQDCFNSVMITLGTGVGGGIILDGKVWRGTNGMAGEIGHITVEAFGEPCRCGSRGCVEQYSSATAIVRMAKELAEEYPESALSINDNLSAHEIYEAGKGGDDLALEVFRRMGFYLGVALSSLLNILNLEVIVIGGGASAGWELFMPEMLETIRHRSYGQQGKKVQVKRSKLGDDAAVLGAARLAFDSLG